MAWVLEFYRPAGQPELLIEELDPLFERMPRFEREPARALDPVAAAPVYFRYRNPISGVEFAFRFQTLPEPEEEIEASSPLACQPTSLLVELPLIEPAATAQEALPLVAEVCLHLHLLVRDPQAEEQDPARPDVDRLIRSYLAQNQAVEETIQHLEDRRRRYLRTALAFFGLLVLSLLLPLLGR